MTGSSNPRFRVLIGWCCLMSAALLMITVFLAIKNQPNTNSIGEEPDSTVFRIPIKDPYKGSPSKFKDYISLIKDNDQESWICSHPCENSSLALKKNGSVEITISGLYFINAQFLFTKSSTINPENKKHEMSLPSATLLRYGHLKPLKKLSEVKRYEAGSVSLIKMVHLTEGDSIRLDIQPHSMQLTIDACHTYWEITLLSNQ